MQFLRVKDPFVLKSGHGSQPSDLTLALNLALSLSGCHSGRVGGGRAAHVGARNAEPREPGSGVERYPGEDRSVSQGGGADQISEIRGRGLHAAAVPADSVRQGLHFLPGGHVRAARPAQAPQASAVGRCLGSFCEGGGAADHTEQVHREPEEGRHFAGVPGHPQPQGVGPAQRLLLPDLRHCQGGGIPKARLLHHPNLAGRRDPAARHPVARVLRARDERFRRARRVRARHRRRGADDADPGQRDHGERIQVRRADPQGRERGRFKTGTAAISLRAERGTRGERPAAGGGGAARGGQGQDAAARRERQGVVPLCVVRLRREGGSQAVHRDVLRRAQGGHRGRP